MTTIDDQELVVQLQRGNRHAFEHLYERHKDGIYAYCFRMLRDAAAAEDSVQETFLKMLNAIGSLREVDSFRPWLYRIARNEVYMHVRRQNPAHLEEDDDVWDEADDPHQQLVLQEERSLLQEMILRLRSDYREALLLCEYDGFSYADIALVTGSSEGAVKSRIFRARQQLAHRFKAQYS